ncbi:MAG: hypothetical protein GC191_05240 [Azospirillum sp.]|nr:hypothetical protein [Azospirillum sp.]
MIYQLLVKVYIGSKICSYLAVPFAYQSESACALQAALIAGTVHGRYVPDAPFAYSYECQASEKLDYLALELPTAPAAAPPTR